MLFAKTNSLKSKNNTKEKKEFSILGIPKIMRKKEFPDQKPNNYLWDHFLKASQDHT